MLTTRNFTLRYVQNFDRGYVFEKFVPELMLAETLPVRIYKQTRAVH